MTKAKKPKICNCSLIMGGIIVLASSIQLEATGSRGGVVPYHVRRNIHGSGILPHIPALPVDGLVCEVFQTEKQSH